MSVWASATLVACAIGLIVLPFVAVSVARSTTRGFVRAAEIGETLQLAAFSLGQASTTLTEASGTLRQVRGSLADSQPLLDSIGTLVGVAAPQTIESARQALLDTQSGAAAIDQVLRGLATLGFLTGVRYDPPEPLDESLGSVADALAPLPESLRITAGNLVSATAEFDEVKRGLDQTADEMEATARSLELLGTLLQEQAVEIQSMSGTVESAAGRGRAVMILGTLGLALTILSGAMTQAAVYVVGRSLARGVEPIGTLRT
jgi:methyl-accepting chemotaxis protein